MPAPEPAPEPPPRPPWWWSERLPYVVLIALGPLLVAAAAVQLYACGLAVWHAAAPAVLPILDTLHP